MADAATHNEQVEDFMWAKIFMFGIKNWQFQGVNDTANRIDNPSG